MMLPAAMGFLLGLVIQGSGTSIVGFYTPFMLLCFTLMPVAIGLMTTFSVSSTLVKLLSYSGFSGLACGMGYQGPQVAVQTTLPASDAPMALAIIIFAQHFGPALFVSIAQTIFTNRLSSNLQGMVKSVNETSIEDMGFAGLASSVAPENLGKVLEGFDKSLIQTWYLAVGLTCLTMVGSLRMEWRSVKKKQS